MAGVDFSPTKPLSCSGAIDDAGVSGYNQILQEPRHTRASTTPPVGSPLPAGIFYLTKVMLPSLSIRTVVSGCSLASTSRFILNSPSSFLIVGIGSDLGAGL